ncbi:MAG: hypothetical protein MUC62_09740 [Candidatus Thermoplasmatota archaeon]|jgi:hypothetical protein|nr:hypothetical protein [Candidatus Thermoplasmatota archaeon]
MRMKVKCGNDDCRTEFFVESAEPVWTCTECGREITNRNYPFLTAKLMQARIDGPRADWMKAYTELLELAKKEVGERAKGGNKGEDLKFLEVAAKKLKGKKRTNEEWKKMHDELLERSRQAVLALET